MMCSDSKRSFSSSGVSSSRKIYPSQRSTQRTKSKRLNSPAGILMFSDTVLPRL